MVKTMAKEHRLILLFTNAARDTIISCDCGEQCGKVPTGTGVPEILKIYREHIRKEDND